MLSARRWQIVGVCAVCLLGSVAAFGQDKERQPLTGVKTVPAMYVAWESKKSPTAQMSKDVPKAFDELWQSCVDNGLHPIGPPTVAVEMQGPPGDTLEWQAWVPIADAPRPEDLAEKAAFRVRAVPQADVAFTCHYGAMYDLQDTFMKLVGWTQAQGLQMSGKARVAMHLWPGKDFEKHVVAECQIEYNK